ncbi:MAG: FtsX-like permease family protein, partial [Bacteroidales bacterium]|nr:FtsX-like permease family protein [Bacteroidales bacterium]
PKPISVFIPDRKNASLSNPVNAFNNDYLQCSGIFSVKQEIDTKYVIVPLSFVRKMMDYKDELTSIEISLKKGYNDKEVQADIQKLLGEKFTVKTRYQQEALLYKVMKSEKWAVFLILVFILLIATFNVIGSVTMLILDKKKDIAILASMGADSKLVRKIFLFEGLIINLAGALIGLSIGALICFLQYEFGFVKLQTSAMFIVTAYPVIMQFWDFILVFATVLIIGFAASYYPTRSISKKYIYHRVNE